VKLGPDRVIVCPACKGLATHLTMQSGNTFGMRIWTDGKQIAPMLLRLPDVVKCRHCNHYFWLSKAKVIEKIVPMSEKLQSAKCIREPDEQGYYETIRAGLARNRKQEKQLRILTWWRSNDAFRDISITALPIQPPTSPEREQNLLALLALMHEPSGYEIKFLEILRCCMRFVRDLMIKMGFIQKKEPTQASKEPDIIMKAEICRELGRWSQAEELLDRVSSAEYMRIAAQIRELCQAKDRCVRELKLDN
jgi:hypothetical protein